MRRGDVLGIIGRNGAGKSTLLKILSRITEPTEGLAAITGRMASLLEVGTGFHPELTGRENIYLNGTILGMKRREIDRKLDEIVAFAEIGKMIDTPVKRYSSGMYVRLGFSVAAHLEPDILVIDEVLSIGDISFQNKCLGKISEVARAGRTVLFVSHNASTVARLCTRAIWIDKGQMVEDGPADSVLQAYMRSSLDNTETRRWDNLESAPGSEDVRLMAVSLLGSDGLPITLADIEKPLKIKLGYYVLKPGAKFRCAATLYMRETCAFGTMETTETVHAAVGYYESSVVIAGNMLAEGDYRVDVSLFYSRGRKVRHVLLSDALVFHIHDLMRGTSARGDYAETFAGVVRPLFPWQIAYCGPQLPDWTATSVTETEEAERETHVT